MANSQPGFERLDRLSDPILGRSLLAAMEQRRDGASTLFARANLARRMGDLDLARAMFAAFVASGTAPGAARMDDWSIVPPGLHSAGGVPVAPLVLIDDLLPVDRMDALHAEACRHEHEFRDRMSGAAAYDPASPRRTLLFSDCTCERAFFGDFVERHMEALRKSLALPPFAVSRIELKMSNTLGGGFLKIHSDNDCDPQEEGRALTLLYYFGAGATSFDGGDLLLFDTNPREGTVSPSWFTRIAPARNRLVAFPSWFFHAVTPTGGTGARFAHGRMGVSCHVRKTAGEFAPWWDAASPPAPVLP